MNLIWKVCIEGEIIYWMVGGFVRQLEDSRRDAVRLRGRLTDAYESMNSNRGDVADLWLIRSKGGVITYDIPNLQFAYAQHAVYQEIGSAKSSIRRELRKVRYNMKVQTRRALTFNELKETEQQNGLEASKAPLRRALNRKMMELCDANPRVWLAEAFRAAMISHRKHLLLCMSIALVRVLEFHRPMAGYKSLPRSEYARRKAFWMATVAIQPHLDRTIEELHQLVTEYYALDLFRSNITPLAHMQNEINAGRAMFARMEGWYAKKELITRPSSNVRYAA